MRIVSRWLVAVVLLVTAMPVKPVSAARGNDYEIPLSELKKVEKKKKPKKAETRKHREKKKGDTTSEKTPNEVSGAAVPGKPETPPPPVAEAMDAPDSAHISHEPYSYVVPGKRTVIKAIISREALRSVRCRFRSLDKGGYASVPMTKTPGNQFTYGAILPALKPEATVLRYRFIIVDASGNQTYSPEFSIPVKPTSLMPGWQQEPDKEPVRVTLEDPRQPLEGFSDVVMEKAEMK